MELLNANLSYLNKEQGSLVGSNSKSVMAIVVAIVTREVNWVVESIVDPVEDWTWPDGVIVGNSGWLIQGSIGWVDIVVVWIHGPFIEGDSEDLNVLCPDCLEEEERVVAVEANVNPGVVAVNDESVDL